MPGHGGAEAANGVGKSKNQMRAPLQVPWRCLPTPGLARQLRPDLRGISLEALLPPKIPLFPGCDFLAARARPNRSQLPKPVPRFGRPQDARAKR